MEKTNGIDLNKFINGGVAEKFNIELKRALENIADPNTSPTKARKITMTLTLKANETRDLIETVVETKLAIAPAVPLTTTLLVGQDKKGNVVGKELLSGKEGQSYFDDEGDVRSDVGDKLEEEAKEPESKVVNFK